MDVKENAWQRALFRASSHNAIDLVFGAPLRMMAEHPDAKQKKKMP
ncbi:hypothetical protein [Parvibaculum sp.]